MIKYQYISFSKNTDVSEIIKSLEYESKQGWELVSHAQSSQGISIILKKDDGLTN